MTESQAYIAFNLAENVGFATVEKLVAKAGSAVSAWEMFPRKISRTGGDVDWLGEEEMASKFGVSIVTPADAAYPRELLAFPGAPLALYVKGKVEALSKPSIAIVGTRRATSYGRSLARCLASDLAAAGWSIVSGLALGIDAEAHRGALDGGGTTVGVLGSALDRFFPEQNRDLAREMIAAEGAVVSEFPFGRPADTTTFPIRNHVVAALTKGVVAVECPLRSGTCITVSMAAEMGKTVMAMPGRVDDRMSAGCLKFIRDGALLVRNADDVLEAISGFSSLLSARSAPKQSRKDPQTPDYSPEEAMIMLHLDEVGITVDDIVCKTSLPVEKVNALAMALRIKGFVRFLPGNRIALSAPRR